MARKVEEIRVVYRSGGTSRMICILVLVGLCLTFLNVACILSPLLVVVVKTPPEGQGLETTTSSSLRKPLKYSSDPPMCSHLQELYGDESSIAIQEAIRQTNKFHQSGGSLKAVQNYLDQQVAPTMRRMDMTYKPLNKDAQETFDYHHAPPIDQYLKDYYQTHETERSGYGKLLPVKFAGPSFRQTLHKDKTRARWMDVLESWDHQRFEVAVGPLLPTCPHMTTVSEGTYENKSYCTASKSEESDCHMFSFGSNDQWSFEEELLALHPECHVHTFDCTLENNEPKNKPNDEKIHFYPYCVSGDDDEDKANMALAIQSGTAVAAQDFKSSDKSNYKHYHELVQVTGVQHSPQVLKMDIEGFEYDVLTNMLNSPPSLWPQQILMEVHYASRMVELEWMLRTRQTAEMAMFFDLLYNKGGYMPAHVKYIEGCPTCMEILLVRVHCAEEAV